MKRLNEANHLRLSFELTHLAAEKFARGIHDETTSILINTLRDYNATDIFTFADLDDPSDMVPGPRRVFRKNTGASRSRFSVVLSDDRNLKNLYITLKSGAFRAMVRTVSIEPGVLPEESCIKKPPCATNKRELNRWDLE